MQVRAAKTQNGQAVAINQSMMSSKQASHHTHEIARDLESERLLHIQKAKTAEFEEQTIELSQLAKRPSGRASPSGQGLT